MAAPTTIAAIRPVLLSAPYGAPDNLEVELHLPGGYRTTGLVEVTLEDGTTGLGEGYIAVFAPGVFTALIELLASSLIGQDASDLGARVRDMRRLTEYWSLQGGARHAISAVEIALIDAVAKSRGVPAYRLLGGRTVERIALYGSGGDSLTKAAMQAEIGLLTERGIGLFKIRARRHEAAKAAWVMEEAAKSGIGVAIDMTQNLAEPAQTVGDIIAFLQDLAGRTSRPLAFLEEALGPADTGSYRFLRGQIPTRIAGGETVTTPGELCRRIADGLYDLAQPDATVIGGMLATLEVFAAARHWGCQAVVHAWGSAVGMLANYHAAFAGGGSLAEWPMPPYALRDDLLAEPLGIADGHLTLSDAPGLGVRLTRDIEARYAFRADAVYNCAPGVPRASEWSDPGL
ncbi:mandelate racemase/muconate lactonizing enzyme family protein [Microvirga pudoricolor]|uniref:mandelate racemase/muconate lactonizing enzyme family protein n=1 Tax=Microvirga pudoricolor TaxID=2778729 RepID=UPI001950AD69|nr:mandelate racemase/muconate lactonizing enzyme family protein [Microvirga pudoricolor]MBM6593639.1 mandelate racemase/muconate lactonizing enzyme family protein [Microvirga pudoricolor]